MDKVPGVLEKGIGNILGGLLGIVCIGAMFGKLVANSGAAQKIAMVLMRVFGEKNLTWALMFTGFLVGIPLFYNVGFVLLVPLVFSVVQQTKVPPIYLGIPMFASLSVTHGFLPPHPGAHRDAADVRRRHRHHAVLRHHRRAAGDDHRRARCSRGLFRNVKSNPITLFVAPLRPESELPSAFNCFASALLPVALIALFDGRAAGARDAAQPALKFCHQSADRDAAVAGGRHVHAGTVARHEDRSRSWTTTAIR